MDTSNFDKFEEAHHETTEAPPAANASELKKEGHKYLCSRGVGIVYKEQRKVVVNFNDFLVSSRTQLILRGIPSRGLKRKALLSTTAFSRSRVP